jgi:hypothetical protein
MQTEVTLCTSDYDDDVRQRERERHADALEALSVDQIANERRCLRVPKVYVYAHREGGYAEREAGREPPSKLCAPPTRAHMPLPCDD